jgi:hypothetical protein
VNYFEAVCPYSYEGTEKYSMLFSLTLMSRFKSNLVSYLDFFPKVAQSRMVFYTNLHLFPMDATSPFIPPSVNQFDNNCESPRYYFCHAVVRDVRPFDLAHR